MDHAISRTESAGPTAAIDMANRAIVIDMIWESSSRGAAVPGLFHDEVTGNTPCSEVVQNGHAGTAG